MKDHVDDRTITATITLPKGTTIGDLIKVRGALFDASTTWVDWEKLYTKKPDAIGVPGVILLALGNAVGKAERG